MIAPTGYTVVLKNVGENVEYDTEQSVVEDVHALLAAQATLMAKDMGESFTSTAILIGIVGRRLMLHMKAKTTDTEDVGGNLDTEGDANINLPLAIFDLNSAIFSNLPVQNLHLSNYSILLIEDGEGETYLTAMPMELVTGQWREDSKGIPYPLDNLLLKTCRMYIHIYSRKTYILQSGVS